MRRKVATLEGHLLDEMVARAEGWAPAGPAETGHSSLYVRSGVYMRVCERELRYSTDWDLGGPIIERELICVSFGSNQEAFPGWSALIGPEDYDQDADATGPTFLVAAMRAYVASKFGEEVEIP